MYYFQSFVKYIDQENYVESIQKLEKHIYFIKNYITYVNICFLEQTVFKPLKILENIPLFHLIVQKKRENLENYSTYLYICYISFTYIY